MPVIPSYALSFLVILVIPSFPYSFLVIASHASHC